MGPRQATWRRPTELRREAEIACLLWRQDDLRKQLSLWQSHLTELTTEQREAEKLRQDVSAARVGASGRTRPACAASS